MNLNVIQVFKASSNKIILDFHVNRTLSTPWFSVSLCSQFAFIFFLDDPVENSARQRDAVAKNIPKTSAKHLKYITPGIILSSNVATGAVSARRGIWWCGHIWSFCLLPSAVFNSNKQHINKHVDPRLVSGDVSSVMDPMFEGEPKLFYISYTESVKLLSVKVIDFLSIKTYTVVHLAFFFT